MPHVVIVDECCCRRSIAAARLLEAWLEDRGVIVAVDERCGKFWQRFLACEVGAQSNHAGLLPRTQACMYVVSCTCIVLCLIADSCMFVRCTYVCYVCMYVCMCVCMSEGTDALMYVYACAHACMYECTDALTYVRKYLYVCMRV